MMIIGCGLFPLLPYWFFLDCVNNWDGRFNDDFEWDRAVTMGSLNN